MTTLDEIRKAQERIAPFVIRTPLVYSPTLSARTNAKVYLKLETLQKAGSFKVRGAMNRILSYPGPSSARGVVAASAGNHAQGVAVAANAAGLSATIVMPVWASLSKQEATRGYGAEILIHGRSLEESIVRAEELAAGGLLFIHPFDDDDVIAGQGTIALEILADLPETDLIVVPVGGGGLIAGIAVAAKGVRPSLEIVGVQAAACPSAFRAFGEGRPVTVVPERTIADGIRVTRTGDRTFPILRQNVERIVLVTEEEIEEAMLLLLERKHLVAEGAGAAPLAAILNGSVSISPGSTIVLVISGGNVDSALLFRIVRQAMVRQGRILRFSVLLGDEPGALARLLTVIAGNGGNILRIGHSQAGPGVPVLMARVELELETRGEEHSRAIKKALEEAGYETGMV